MFEKVPVVGYKTLDGKIDQHYFRKYLDELHKDTSNNYPGHKEHIEKRAKLEQLESSIRSGVKSINGKFVFIGEVLRSIEDDGLFSVVSDGNGNYCKNIYKYATLRFGLKKTSTFNLIGIAKEFACLGELKKEWKDFSYSQLSEMLSMSEEDRKKVSSNMTVKQIRELKNTFLALQNEIQTSEQIDYEISDAEEEVCKISVVDKLAVLLEEGDAYHLWLEGKKNFVRLAEWLISKGVKLK